MKVYNFPSRGKWSNLAGEITLVSHITHKTIYFLSEINFINTSGFWCFLVPLGSIEDLPVETCKEIKASEGQSTVSAKYWLYNDLKSGTTRLAYCDMEKEGKFS